MSIGEQQTWLDVHQVALRAVVLGLDDLMLLISSGSLEVLR